MGLDYVPGLTKTDKEKLVACNKQLALAKESFVCLEGHLRKITEERDKLKAKNKVLADELNKFKSESVATDSRKKKEAV